MLYSVVFSRQAIKALENINAPFYSNIKQAIIDLTKNQRPVGYKN